MDVEDDIELKELVPGTSYSSDGGEDSDLDYEENGVELKELIAKAESYKNRITKENKEKQKEKDTSLDTEHSEGVEYEFGVEDEEKSFISILKQAFVANKKGQGKDEYLCDGNINALLGGNREEKPDYTVKIVDMNNIHKTYLLGVEGVPALRGVDLQVQKGEFVIIFGTSGGGKTSMLNIMGTIDKPTKGTMHLCNTRISRSTTDVELSAIRRSKLGFVFQTFNLLSSLTALENVMLPMILEGKLSRRERKARAIDLLTRVGMSERLGHLPSQLSGGEQQRVTIARSISNNPEILLLDEPTGDLDTKNTTIVMKLLTDLHQKDNITLVMVTHELSLKYFADRVVWMRDGKVQKVEIVKEAQKKMAYEKLREDLIKFGLNFDEDPTEQLELVVEEMDEEPPLESVTFTRTTIREPRDYPQVMWNRHSQQ